MKKIQNAVTALSFITVLVSLAISSIIAPDSDISYSERRTLAQFPEFSWNAIFKKEGSDSYFDDMETYLLDQFIARDRFRTLNVSYRRYIFMQNDIDGIIVKNDRIFKMDYTLNEEAVRRSANVYLKVIEKYFSENGANIYYTIVPDKNFYSAQGNYLSMDYAKLFTIMHENLGAYEFIDISDKLSADDYYRTDLHWDQTKLFGVANEIISCMGGEIKIDPKAYKEEVFEGFTGAYYGQVALPIKPDNLIYLTSPAINGSRVYDYECGKYVGVYATEKLGGIDSYDVFLHGARSILRIENSSCENGKELVIFRDSFGSSLAPLLIENYSSITLVDLRYVSSSNLSRFIEFSDNCDVLFMYNTGSLNTKGQGSIS